MPLPENYDSGFPNFDLPGAPLLWRFVLADSTTMENIAELQSSSTNLSLALNKPGSCKLTIAADTDVAELVTPITTCVKAYRKGVLIWSGMVWITEDVLPDNQLTIDAVGWFEQLNHRELRYEKKYEGSANTGGQIALNLLSTANGQKSGPLSAANPDGTGLTYPTFMTVGTTTDAQIRNRVYPKWQKIGQAITELTEIENGFDFQIMPDTRVMNVYANTVGSELRRDRTQAQFGYNWGPNNLSSFKRQIDSSTLITQIHAGGPFGIATATAGPPGPIEDFGLWEEFVSLSEVKDSTLLQAYANGEIATRSVPRTIYNLTPFPYTGQARVPEPFVDYRIGDQVYFTARYAKRISIERQAVRVYGINVTVDDNGNETLGDLQLSPN